jgi:hypothetical protein
MKIRHYVSIFLIFTFLNAYANTEQFEKINEDNANMSTEKPFAYTGSDQTHKDIKTKLSVAEQQTTYA